MYGGPFVGGRTIGERWAEAVGTPGSIWTVDSVMTDDGTVLRGDEWYEFDPETGLIEEIRAYYASPQDDSLDRLDGFDYEERDHPGEPPFSRE